MAALAEAAEAAYGCGPVLPVAGAQAGIQMIPQLAETGQARILGPTYNEHAASFEAAGWQVQTVTNSRELAGSDAAVVVNPNNPDGRILNHDALMDLARKVGLLVVDESFADPTPEVSVAPLAVDNIIVLRSFGKFFGLAGLRLGFVLATPDTIDRLAAFAGPWPVSGAAIEIGRAALADGNWQTGMRKSLTGHAERLDDLANAAGWSVVGGTTLFRLYDTPDAAEAQTRLAEGKVLGRVFPYSDRWVRLGLPPEGGWAQVRPALQL